jgi:type I restriction enzyme M protein
MLIENYLWCVVSLPAGCFNPYSGVKTSVLLLDKSLAKRTDEILFVKVESDGFDLGAQRRPIEKNDLPGALSVMLRCHSGLDPESSAFLDSPVKPGNDKSLLAHFVPRKRILESGDVNLSGDRYRATGIRVSTKWPMVRLGEVCLINPPRAEVTDLDGNIEVSFIPMSDLNEHQPTFDVKQTRRLKDVIRGYTYFKDDDVLLAKITPCFENGKAGIAKNLKNAIGFGSTEFIVLRPNLEKILPELVYHFITKR